MPTDMQLGEFIGKRYDAPELRQFIVALGPVTEDRKIGAPDRVYYTFAQAGCELIVDKRTNRVTTLFLHSPAHGLGHPHQVTLPYGLEFSMLRDQVNKLMPVPDEAASSHDAWEKGPFTFRIDYANGAIKLLLLTSF